MEEELKENVEESSGQWPRTLFRSVIALNFLRFGLSFFPCFEGTAKQIGEADRLFGSIRLGGFRADFAWLVLSSLVILFATFYFGAVSKSDRGARLDVFLCLAWTVAFAFYLWQGLLSGLLDFG